MLINKEIQRETKTLNLQFLSFVQFGFTVSNKASGENQKQKNERKPKKMRNQLKEIEEKLERIAKACEYVKGTLQTAIIGVILWFITFGGGYKLILAIIQDLLK